MKKRELDERIKLLPEVYGIFGVKREGKYIYFGWSKNIRECCRKYLVSKRFGADVEFEKMDAYAVGIPELTLKKEVFELARSWMTLWPHGFNRRHPVTNKWINRGRKMGKSRE